MAREPSHPYLILDVFTDTALEGNPLAVFTEGEEVPSRLMQAAARELNLSETVFLLPGDNGSDAQLRIFTPTGELQFAGHPTLGAAFVVAEREELSSVRLRTGAGIVPVHLRRDEGELVYGEMEQPIPTAEPFTYPEALLEALGVTQPALPVEMYVNGPEHLLVGLSDAASVAELEPDMSALAFAAPQATISCFAIDSAVDRDRATGVKTRVFCPGLGVTEDPATGSAAGPLALHLARNGLTAFGETLRISQGDEIGRPSILTARAEGSVNAVTRILVGGGAVRVAAGHFRLQ